MERFKKFLNELVSNNANSLLRKVCLKGTKVEIITNEGTNISFDLYNNNYIFKITNEKEDVETVLMGIHHALICSDIWKCIDIVRFNVHLYIASQIEPESVWKDFQENDLTEYNHTFELMKFNEFLQKDLLNENSKTAKRINSLISEFDDDIEELENVSRCIACEIVNDFSLSKRIEQMEE